jgi:hypothetical protein
MADRTSIPVFSDALLPVDRRPPLPQGAARAGSDDEILYFRTAKKMKDCKS